MYKLYFNNIKNNGIQLYNNGIKTQKTNNNNNNLMNTFEIVNQFTGQNINFFQKTIKHNKT